MERDFLDASGGADMSGARKKYIFVARLAPKAKEVAYGVSAAGDQVQRKIGEVLSNLLGLRRNYWFCWRPMRGWPHGPFFAPELTSGAVEYPSSINIPIVRDFVWAIHLLRRLGREANCVAVFYNVYLADMLVIELLRLVRKRPRVCIIVQDVRIHGSGFSWRARLHDFLAMRFLRYADLTVAVTDAILRDFKVSSARGVVFNGGITEIAEELLKSTDEISAIALYAGAIEPHNGILRLASKWIDQSISTPLHIFGRGSDSVALARLVEGNSNVIFHGFQNSAEILSWQRRAAINICMRFDDGLNQEYFFPSKFYNAVCAPGAVMVNSFKGIPEKLSEYLIYLDEDMSNLRHLVEKAVEENPSKGKSKNIERQKIVRTEFQWETCVKNILVRMSSIR